MKIKTMNDWKYDFGTDFTPGDRVDEEVYLHFLNVLPPLTNKYSMLQVSEPYNHLIDEEDGKLKGTYTTFIKDDISWIYCGNCFKGKTKHIK